MRARAAAAALVLAVAPPAGAAGAPVCARVEFEGVRALGEGTLRRALGLPFAAESLSARVRLLARLYHEQGYVEAAFAAETRDGGLLRLRVDEGEPARLAQVFVRGCEAVAEVEVREILDLAPGQIFRSAGVESRLRGLVDDYALRGYMDAEAVIERLEYGPEGVILGIALAEGPRGTLAEVSVQGNHTSRADLVQRLARLPTPQPASARRIREAPQLLRRSGLFADVEAPVLYRVGSGGNERLGVLLRVVEAERRHNVFGAVGVARDPVRDRAVLTGAVDLALRNIYGTGRDLSLAWKRDALAGSRLALAYRERFLLGTPLDLAFDVAQTVRDSTYTAQSLGGALVLPVARTLGVEVGAAVDRSVFHAGVQGNTLRLRYRVGMLYSSLGREVDGRRFGSLEVRAEYARRRNDLRGGGAGDRARVRQTLWSGRFEAGAPLRRRHVVAVRGEWYALDAGEPEASASELYYFGGARTLRGYREEQFRGDQVAFGGVEYRYGDPRAAQVYAFVDAGALRRKRRDAPRDASAHVGYGLGFRAQVATGALDVSFGVGDERSLAATKVHVSFLQRF